MTSKKLPDSAEADRFLLQRVKGCLHQRGYASHRTLEISVQRGVVVVQGRVPTFYLRQIAVECIKRVAGVTQVVDLIKVVDGPVQPEGSASIEDEQESSESSLRHRMDLQDMAQSKRDAPHTHVCDRDLHSSAGDDTHAEAHFDRPWRHGAYRFHDQPTLSLGMTHDADVTGVSIINEGRLGTLAEQVID